MNIRKQMCLSEFFTEVGKHPLKECIQADKHLFPDKFHVTIRMTMTIVQQTTKNTNHKVLFLATLQDGPVFSSKLPSHQEWSLTNPKQNDPPPRQLELGCHWRATCFHILKQLIPPTTNQQRLQVWNWNKITKELRTLPLGLSNTHLRASFPSLRNSPLGKWALPCCFEKHWNHYRNLHWNSSLTRPLSCWYWLQQLGPTNCLAWTWFTPSRRIISWESLPQHIKTSCPGLVNLPIQPGHRMNRIFKCCQYPRNKSPLTDEEEHFLGGKSTCARRLSFKRAACISAAPLKQIFSRMQVSKMKQRQQTMLSFHSTAKKVTKVNR